MARAGAGRCAMEAAASAAAPEDVLAFWFGGDLDENYRTKWFPSADGDGSRQKAADEPGSCASCGTREERAYRRPRCAAVRVAFSPDSCVGESGDDRAPPLVTQNPRLRNVAAWRTARSWNHSRENSSGRI